MCNQNYCFNCNHFFSDPKDFDSGFGICFNKSDVFEDFYDEIFEEGEFSSCMELYDQERFDGSNAPCKDFDISSCGTEGETDDKSRKLTEEEETLVLNVLIKASLRGKIMEEDFFRKIETGSDDEASDVFSTLQFLLADKDSLARKKLIKYFKETGPFDNIKDIRRRTELIGILRYIRDEKTVIELFINELYKTPSNNTTRQLYNAIFRYFQQCKLENLEEPLLEYIDKSKCSYRIKKRILGILDDIAYFQDDFMK